MSRNSTRRKGGNSRARLRLPRLFPPLECPGCGARIMRRALGGACILRPLPLLRLAVSAAGGARLRSPSTKFYGKSRTRRFAPRTQFAVKFPCRCHRRRRMSADGADFRLFRQSGLPCQGRCRLRRRRGALPPCSGTVPARLPQRPSESRRKHRPAGVSRRRCVFCGESLFPKATRSKASPARGGAASGGGGVHCRLAADLSLRGRRSARQKAAANIAPQAFPAAGAFLRGTPFPDSKRLPEKNLIPNA